MEVGGDMTMGEKIDLIYEATSAGTKGILNWSEVNTTHEVEAGHYDGGLLDSRPSYQKGYADGAAAAKDGLFKLTYLGTGTSVNVSAYTSNWANLTVDNFFCRLKTLQWKLYNGNNSGSYWISYSNGTLSVGIPNVKSSDSYVYTGIELWMWEKA